MDLRELIGCPCEVAITHRETEGGLFADVEVTRYKGTAKLPPLVSEPIFFSLHHSDFNADVLEALPEKLRDKIKRGETYKDLMAQRALNELSTPDIISDDIAHSRAPVWLARHPDRAAQMHASRCVGTGPAREP
jgi:hypothetical protein